MRIVCTYTQADKLLPLNKLDFCNDVVTFSENKLISPKSQGLIRGISTDYSNEEMMEALKNQHVCALRRFEHVENNIRTPTGTILLTFSEGQTCPLFIKLVLQLVRVIEFIPTPSRCSNCQLHEHTLAVCKRTKKCAKCGAQHSTNDCVQ